jgi:hypothetical protein
VEFFDGVVWLWLGVGLCFSLVDPAWRCLVHGGFWGPADVGPCLFGLSAVSGEVAFFAAIEAGSSWAALCLAVLSCVDSLAPLSGRSAAS